MKRENGLEAAMRSKDNTRPPGTKVWLELQE